MAERRTSASHGIERCTCTSAGEDPHCPHHGYEAVIARLRHQAQWAMQALETIADGTYTYRGRRGSYGPRALRNIARKALDVPGTDV